MAERVRVAPVDEFKPGEARRVELDGVPVAVFNVDGAFHAIGDTCSHEEASLSEGFLEDTVVECPKHGAMFDVTTGAHRSLPATRPVPAFETEVEDGIVYVKGMST